jgi:hypothetical protein
MSTWIDQAVGTIEQQRQAQERKATEARIIANHSQRFWDETCVAVQADIETINLHPALQGDPRGKLRFADCNGWAFEIYRASMLELRVEYQSHTRSLGIVRGRTRESLSFALDGEDKLCVMAQTSARTWDYNQLAEYLLSPLLA